jgi:hypothetical protein
MLRKILIIAAVLGILLISFSVFHYLVILPSERQDGLARCMNAAHENYIKDWNLKCVGEKRENDCKLPGYLADKAEVDRRADEEQCIKLYK